MFLKAQAGLFGDGQARPYVLITNLLDIKLPTPKREWAIQLFLFLFLEQPRPIPFNTSAGRLGLRYQGFFLIACCKITP